MLYFTYGTDRDKVRLRNTDIIESLLIKKPNATLVRFDDETLTETALEECLGGQGLFERKFIVGLSDLLGDEEKKGLIQKWIKDIAQSDNVFVWRESKVDAKTKKKIEKYATKIQIFGEVDKSKAKKSKAANFDVFDMANALGRKDKKALWVLLQKAKLAGVAVEGIHGTLHWQVRSILAVLLHPNKNANELALAPYPYQKARDYSRNYTKGSIRKISRQLLEMHQRAREGGEDLDTALEKFILNM